MYRGNNYQMLWSGNTNKDASVIYQGPNNELDGVLFDVLGDSSNPASFSNFIRSNVYSLFDVDMNASVIFQGPANEPDLIFFEVFTHPENTSQFVNFIIRQQLP